MGAAAPFLTYLSAGLSVVQAIQGMQQANAAAKATEANTRANIINEQNRATIDKTRQQRLNRQNTGTARVNAAASGAQLNSFDDVMGDSYSQGLLDEALIEYDSKLRQEQLRYGGAVQAQEYKNEAKSSLLSGIGGGLQKGISGYQSNSKAPKTTKLKNGETIYWNS